MRWFLAFFSSFLLGLFLFFPADDDDDEAGPDNEDGNAGPDHDYIVVPIIVNIIIHFIVTL